MILMRIDDFKSKRCVAEYLILYSTSATCALVSTAYFLSDLAAHWALLSVALMLMSIALLLVTQQIRSKRAQEFYQEWVSTLDSKDILELKHRLREHCAEQNLIDSIKK
ncbi:hypothetical protein ACOI22_01290 [Glaciecola sp. 2405UD65-10]|uniref:hypothetical protein n=1 Tax=Glaciecola sp. 2405UD65-10 TaxID=3397244 RepID=UPI003B5B7F56